MYLIDTHSHIYLDHFDNDRDEVIERARKAGLGKILLPNIDSGSLASMNKVCRAYPGFCFPMVGLHPTSVKEDFHQELQMVRQELEGGNYIGIGEIGIDLYWDKTFLNEQLVSFSTQINWALEFELPFVIHCREAFDEVFDVLEKINNAPYRGIFHAFTGSLVDAHRAIALGFKLGIGGVLTYPKAKLDEVIRAIDLSHLVLETDSPFLPPVPKRGKRNEPSFLIFTLEKLADIHGVSIELIRQLTTHNAEKLFFAPNI